MSLPVIGFAGMTHLGLVSGVCAANKGFELVCFDPDAEVISELSKGNLPVSEPQLQELIVRNSLNIHFTNDVAKLNRCDLVYVAPDVDTDDVGQSDLAAINALLNMVYDATRADAVVVVLSQVPPGFTRNMQRTGRHLYYQVETLVFGRAVERALHPERYIVGCADPAQVLPEYFQIFLKAYGCPILQMRFESAELAKISINMCLVASVTAANTIAELCESIGADWSEIEPSLRLDRRIGQHAYLSPGLGIAGGNMERDLATVCDFAQRYGTDASVVRAWLHNSRHRKNWAVTLIKRLLLTRSPGATVAVWGLAYKENTHSTKNSPALHTIAQLPGTIFRMHDPQVPALAVTNPEAVRFATALEAASGADALMILTPWQEYRLIPILDLLREMRGRIVLDPYGVLCLKNAEASNLKIYTLGRSL